MAPHPLKKLEILKEIEVIQRQIQTKTISIQYLTNE